MRRLVMLIVVGLVLGACGSSVDGATGDVAGADPGDTGATAPSPAAGDGASDDQSSSASPDVVPFGVVQTVDGASLDGADYAGDSLALWFWAPW